MFRLPRFYPILDPAAAEAAGIAPLDLARIWVDAGVEIVQFRHKGAWNRRAFHLAAALGEIVQGAGARYIVNDRADVALLIRADGVHLGQDDLPPRAARRLLGEERLVGFSTHNSEQLSSVDAEPADYLALGPIFATLSKRRPDPQVGLGRLARLRSRTPKPLAAIGGIRRSNAADVFAAGADSIAVISDLLDHPARAVREWLEAAR